MQFKVIIVIIVILGEGGFPHNAKKLRAALQRVEPALVYEASHW